jgi:ribonuclease P protein component
MNESQPDLRNTLKYNEKLHAQKDFERVFRFGKKIAHAAILVYIYQHLGDIQPRRIGLVTSRKLGIAINRNRLKRRLREIFRTNKNLFPGLADIIFVPRPAVMKLNYKQLKTLILSLVSKTKEN